MLLRDLVVAFIYILGKKSRLLYAVSNIAILRADFITTRTKSGGSPVINLLQLNLKVGRMDHWISCESLHCTINVVFIFNLTTSIREATDIANTKWQRKRKQID